MLMTFGKKLKFKASQLSNIK